MSKNLWLRNHLLASLLLFSWASAEEVGMRPNIVWIVTDNQPASIMGVYGNPDVETPRIAELAAQGMRFDRAFAVHGMCSPTRATLLTGLIPSQHGVHDWLDDEQMKNWPPDWNAVREFRTLPYTLKNRGYQTALIGKWHLGRPQLPPEWFDYWVTFSVGHTTDFWNNDINDNGNKYLIDNLHSVDFLAEKAATYLRNRMQDQPFFLMVTFNGPYLSPPTNLGAARNRHYEGYKDRTFSSFPRNRVNEEILRQTSPTVSPFSDWFMDLARMHNDRQTMANVASQNTMVDDGVGRILDALENNGLANNTLVIYTSDQGSFYGQHGLWGTTSSTFPASLYDAPMLVPLIVRYPGVVAEAQISDLLVGQYDLMPTILDLAGFGRIEIENSPGRSFADYLRGADLADWHDAVFMDHEATRAIRTEQFSYWKRLSGTGAHKLFDIRRDPDQLSNVYDAPEYAEVVKDLDARLTDFFERYSDTQYDLWRGGTVKGSTDYIHEFKAIYGKEWEPLSQIKEAYREPHRESY